ncbi:MAG: polymer-forming cytoskeletal protein [Roseivirga sp.]|nr:polymer-forming cytoskeletal protein [Roseivirga sp.]
MKRADTSAISCIGEGTVFTGDIDTRQSLLVKGTVDGNIKAGSVIVSGEVKGNIEVLDLLELTETAHIYGDIYARQLRVLNGGIFNGSCSVSGSQ